MSTKTERRCRHCSIGKVRPVAKGGRQGSYKNLAGLAIPAEIEIPTCDNCGAEWLDLTTSKRIDHALEKVYRGELRVRVRTAIETVIKAASQSRLESLLGMSQGYLSKLRSGARDPSPELVSQLALLASDPVKRVRELEEYWKARPKPVAKKSRRHAA